MRLSNPAKQTPCVWNTADTPNAPALGAGDDTQMASFAYVPLGDDQLRLLEFWSAGDSCATRGERLTFTLRPYDRDQAPAYTALSYTWGTESATKATWINGKTFHVRPNLYACLTRVHAFRDRWRRLWIDAICVDQASVTERNAQVRRMDMTFSRATRVLAWLGDVSDDDPDFQPGLLGRVLTPVSGLEDRWQVNFTSPLLLGRLLRLPYWERMWIVQELRLARNVQFLWGSRTFQATAFIPFANIYHIFIPSWYSLPGGLYTRRYAVDSPSSMYGELDGHWRQLSRGVFLGTLIAQHRAFNATDRRDRIFALLGLLSEESRRVLLQVLPDYSMSFETVMLIAMAAIRQEVPVLPYRVIRAVYSPKMLQLDEGVCNRLWKTVEEYETPGSLYTAARHRNLSRLRKLQPRREGVGLSPEQDRELEHRVAEHESFVNERVRVLRVLAHASLPVS